MLQKTVLYKEVSELY